MEFGVFPQISKHRWYSFEGIGPTILGKLPLTMIFFTWQLLKRFEILQKTCRMKKQISVDDFSELVARYIFIPLNTPRVATKYSIHNRSLSRMLMPKPPSRYEDRLSRYMDFHYKDKTVVRTSYLNYGNHNTVTTMHLYWDGPWGWGWAVQYKYTFLHGHTVFILGRLSVSPNYQHKSWHGSKLLCKIHVYFFSTNDFKQMYPIKVDE